MAKNDLKEFEGVVHKRLDRLCESDPEYQDCIQKEEALCGKLRERLADEDLLLIQEYQRLICDTGSVREMLAYRQGMRDHAGILGIESRGVPSA